MPPKKGSPDKGKKSSPDKSGKSPPEKGKKPSPEKGKKSSPAKGESNGDDPDARPLYQLPQRNRDPTPPRIVGPPDADIMRQHWYKYANEPTLTLQEWYWTPYFPLLTSWGDLLVSDPPRRRIWCYHLDRYVAKATRFEEINVKGEPYFLAEMPKYSRIITVIRCPGIQKYRVTLLNTETREFGEPREYPFEYLENDNEEKASQVNENTVIGVVGYEGYIFVIRSPIQRIEVLTAKTMKPINTISFQNEDKHNEACTHLEISGGCAASDGKLYLAANRPPRVAVFKIDIFDFDTINCVHLMDIELDKMRNPYGLALDSRNMLLITDSMWDFIRWNRSDGTEIGTMGDAEQKCLRLRRPQHISVTKNGVIAVVEAHSNTVKIFIDTQIFNWYFETLFYIDTVKNRRRLVDVLVPPFPPPVAVYHVDPPIGDIDVDDCEDLKEDLTLTFPIEIPITITVPVTVTAVMRAELLAGGKVKVDKNKDSPNSKSKSDGKDKSPKAKAKKKK